MKSDFNAVLTLKGISFVCLNCSLLLENLLLCRLTNLFDIENEIHGSTISIILIEYRFIFYLCGPTHSDGRKFRFYRE
jgi:hypothetical protein